jgi:hypothetical protein
MKPPAMVYLLAILSTAACARPPPQEPEFQGQSYREALRTLCDADRLAGLESESDPLEKGQRREDWLNDRIKNPDAIYFRTLLKVQGPTEKSSSLRAEAKECGLESCRLAETIALEGL